MRYLAILLLAGCTTELGEYKKDSEYFHKEAWKNGPADPMDPDQAMQYLIQTLNQ